MKAYSARKTLKKAKYSAILIILTILFLKYFDFRSIEGETLNSLFKYVIVALILTSIICFVPAFIKKLYKRKHYLNSPLYQIDRMAGEEFEEYLYYQFKLLGYAVKTTPKSNDYGADLILKKDGIKTVVQAKRYNDKVSNAAIQEIVAAKGYYHAEKAMVVTNSYFTQNAYKLADANNVELWDRKNIVKMLPKVTKDKPVEKKEIKSEWNTESTNDTP